MSDSNRIDLAYIEETTWGTTPSGSLTGVRLTGEGLKQETQTTESEEIREDREIADIIRTSINAAGPINFELSYGMLDDLIAGAMLSTWNTSVDTVSSVTDIDAASTDNSYNATSSDLSVFGVGEWIEVRGFTEAANNGYKKVVSAAAGKLVVEQSLTDESSGDSITIKEMESIVNGTTLRSFTLQRDYNDLSSEFARYVGCMIDQFSLNVETDSIITGSMNIMGKNEESASSTLGSVTAAPSNQVMNAIDHVPTIEEATSAIEIINFGFQFNNNLRTRPVVGQLGSNELGKGGISVTGTLRAYFQDSALFDKYLNFNETSLALVTEDASGNAYVWDIPAIKFTDGSRVAGGRNQDVVADLSFGVKRDAADGNMIKIARVAG